MGRFRTYDISEIQKVYRRHTHHHGTVIYSSDKGSTWQIVGVDSGKWKIREWLFAFIEVGPARSISELERSKGRSENYYDLSSEQQWAEDKQLGILDWDGQ